MVLLDKAQVSSGFPHENAQMHVRADSNSRLQNTFILNPISMERSKICCITFPFLPPPQQILFKQGEGIKKIKLGLEVTTTTREEVAISISSLAPTPRKAERQNKSGN